MDTSLTITALARKTGVSARALRYWESLGLVPRAARSASAYRRFPAEAVAYVGFVQRSKDLGLTLQQMRTILKLARQGRSPCADVETFIGDRILDLEEKIASLTELLQSLRKFRQCASGNEPPSDRSRECCCLLVGLPEEEAFLAHAGVGADQPHRLPRRRRV